MTQCYCVCLLSVGDVFTPFSGVLNNVMPRERTDSSVDWLMASSCLSCLHPRTCFMWTDNTIAFTLVFIVVTIHPWPPPEVVWLNPNPCSGHLGCIYKCNFMWSSSITLHWDHTNPMLMPSSNGVFVWEVSNQNCPQIVVHICKYNLFICRSCYTDLSSFSLISLHMFLISFPTHHHNFLKVPLERTPWWAISYLVQLKSDAEAWDVSSLAITSLKNGLLT